MAVRTIQVQGVPVLEAEGRITVGSGSVQLRDGGQAALANLGRFLVVDFDGTTLMDSSGVGELVALQQAASKAGGQLVLARVPDSVADVLQRAGLLSAFRVFSSQAEAARFITDLDDYP